MNDSFLENTELLKHDQVILVEPDISVRKAELHSFPATRNLFMNSVLCERVIIDAPNMSDISIWLYARRELER